MNAILTQGRAGTIRFHCQIKAATSTSTDGQSVLWRTHANYLAWPQHFVNFAMQTIAAGLHAWMDTGTDQRQSDNTLQPGLIWRFGADKVCDARLHTCGCACSCSCHMLFFSECKTHIYSIYINTYHRCRRPPLISTQNSTIAGLASSMDQALCICMLRSYT